jgi:hypothetical protein
MILEHYILSIDQYVIHVHLMKYIDGQFIFERNPVMPRPWMRYGRAYTHHMQDAMARMLDIPLEHVQAYFAPQRFSKRPSEASLIDINALLSSTSARSRDELFFFADANVISAGFVVVFPYLPSLDTRIGERGSDALVKCVLGTPIQQYARFDEMHRFSADDVVRNIELTQLIHEFEEDLYAHNQHRIKATLIDLNKSR